LLFLKLIIPIENNKIPNPINIKGTFKIQIGISIFLI